MRNFAWLLTLLFIALKLTGYIDWAWYWVLAPIPITLLIGMIMLLLVVLLVRSNQTVKSAFLESFVTELDKQLDKQHKKGK